MRRHVPLLVLALALASCGDDSVVMRDSGPVHSDGSVEIDAAGRDAVADDAALSSDADVADAGSLDSGSRDSGEEDARTDGGSSDASMRCPTDADPPPPDEPSRQTVRFHVRGAAGWVVTGGFLCSGLGISGVTLGLPFQCVCECPRPPDPSVTQAQPIAADGTVVAWDGRGLSTYGVCVDCEMRGWPGGGLQTEQHGAWQPVPAGRRTASFAIVDSVPAGCTEPPDGSLACGMTFPMSPPFPPAPYGLCPATRTITVDFDLPASGDLDVNVDVPPAG